MQPSEKAAIVDLLSLRRLNNSMTNTDKFVRDRFHELLRSQYHDLLVEENAINWRLMEIVAERRALLHGS